MAANIISTTSTRTAGSRAAQTADVRFGSGTDIEAHPPNVRFTPQSRRRLSALGCPLSAKSGHQQAGGPFAEARIRSAELIVQPDAEDMVPHVSGDRMRQRYSPRFFAPLAVRHTVGACCAGGAWREWPLWKISTRLLTGKISLALEINLKKAWKTDRFATYCSTFWSSMKSGSASVRSNLRG